MAACALKHTGADEKLVEYVDKLEILTTKDKIVDPAHAERDLGMCSSVTLDAGVKNTVEWMKEYYKI